MAEIVSVISGMGGTGKTSLCAAVASCLAAGGARVLCIDADVGLRNLDISLGMSDEPILPFTAVMRGEYPLEKASVHPRLAGLRVLTAPITESAESLDAGQFARLLRQAEEHFDWIFLDAPAGIGAGFRLATGEAGRAIVVAASDPASLRDAARATDVLLAENPRIEAQLVVNRVSPVLYRRMQATIDDVMDGVGLPLLGIVPEDSGVTLAAAKGVPLPLYSEKGAARACRNIARRLCGQKVPLMLF